jgi:hypothetical protein
MLEDVVLFWLYACWIGATTIPLGTMLGSSCSPCCRGGACPPGYVCCGTAEYLLDFCEEVDGQWVISGTNDPCECAAGFTQTELIEQEPFPGAGFNVRILRCFIRDCEAVGDECCIDPTPEDCIGPDPGQWPGGRFGDVNVGPGGAFQFFQIGCYENPLP